MDASDVLEVRHASFPTILDRVYPTKVQRHNYEYRIDGVSTTHGTVYFMVDEYCGQFDVQYWADLDYSRELRIVPHLKWRVFWATRMQWLTERVFGFL